MTVSGVEATSELISKPCLINYIKILNQPYSVYRTAKIIEKSIVADSFIITLLAMKLRHIPLDYFVIELISGRSRNDVIKEVRDLASIHRIPIPPGSPSEYFDLIFSVMNVSIQVRAKTRRLWKKLKKNNFTGRRPLGIAASIVYMAAELTDQSINQSQLTRRFLLSKTTIFRYTKSFVTHL